MPHCNVLRRIGSLWKEGIVVRGAQWNILHIVNISCHSPSRQPISLKWTEPCNRWILAVLSIQLVLPWKKTKQCNEFVEVEINDAANERTFRTQIILCNNYFRLTSTIANSSEDEKVLCIGDFGRELFLSSPRLQRENTEVKSLVLDKVW